MSVDTPSSQWFVVIVDSLSLWRTYTGVRGTAPQLYFVYQEERIVPYTHPYFLGSQTDFFDNGVLVGSLAEGTSLGQELSEVVAQGKTSGDTFGQYTFSTKFFFTFDKSNPKARIIVYGAQSYWPDTDKGDVAGGFWVSGLTGTGYDWANPALMLWPPGYDPYNWFVIGSGWNAVGDPDPTSTFRTTAPDGVTQAGTQFVTSASAAFSTADIGGTITDSAGYIPAGTVITWVSGNSANLNAYCRGSTTVDSFSIGRSTSVPNVGSAAGYVRDTLSTNFGVVNPGWRDSMVIIYAPLVAEAVGYANAHLFGIKGGKTRCSDMTLSQPLVTTHTWGFPHADYDRTFGVFMDESQQYGSGAALESFLWVPTA
jgi:hypothetical protein